MSVLKVQGNSTGTGTFTVTTPATNTDRTITLPDAAGTFVTADASGDVAITGDLTVDTSTLYVDSANNRVGIGTTSPTSNLQLDGAEDRTGGLTLSAGGQNHTYFLSSDYVNVHNIETSSASAAHTWQTNGTERARIDSSGNLLVGKTSASTGTVGVEFRPDGLGVFGRSSDYPIILNRTTSDGGIALFRKDGATVGSIGNNGTRPYICSTAHGVYFGSSATLPVNGSGTPTDNTYDFGVASYRWDDIYATNGTIQTSDANEKQQIASLTDAEITAAKAISKLFKTFKWNDKVEAKGDAARTHTGVIAQEVQQAMTDAGLDAGNYAFFISNTWWETQTEVPAVEADEENGIEAQEAYTRTDTYDTAEEAPEGATERTRLGIRYPELLSFIGAATEQRLASIEARLDALEAV